MRFTQGGVKRLIGGEKGDGEVTKSSLLASVSSMMQDCLLQSGKMGMVCKIQMTKGINREDKGTRLA